MKVEFKTKGTCSSLIEIQTEQGIIEEVRFQGGCNGNLKGICSLVKGMPVAEVIQRLEVSVAVPVRHLVRTSWRRH